MEEPRDRLVLRAVPGDWTAPRPKRLGRVVPAMRLFLSILRQNPLTFTGFVLVVLVVGAALTITLVPLVSQALLGHAASVLPYPPNQLTLNYDQPPSWSHWFGTDEVGRDVFSRVLAALPLDLGIGLFVATVSLVGGGGLGLVAGFWNGPGKFATIASSAILRVTDVFLAFPTLVLAIAVAEAIGHGEATALIAVTATWWTFYVRLARGEVLAIKTQPYVLAARAAGMKNRRILLSHVLPNLIDPMVVYYTMDIGSVIVTYSTISYLSIGVPLNVPEWGEMCEEYQAYLTTYPWMVIGVSIAILVTVLAFALLGDGLREILDPRSRRLTVTAGRGAAGAGASSST
jgi:ABC-type dipeptide/oligopeptide/nickel transport system permease subunit